MVENYYRNSRFRSRNKIQSRAKSWGFLTRADDAGSGSIFYLDRHSVVCPRDQVITGFHFFRPNGKIAYEFSCVQVALKNANARYTDWNDVDRNERRSVNYLDRHNVMCQDNEALQSFKLARSGNRIRYEFTCVQIPSDGCTNSQNGWTSLGDYTTYYLDRQTVKAPEGSALSGFKLNTDYRNGGNMWYTFKTCKFKTTPVPTINPTPSVTPNSNQSQGTNKNNFKQDTLYQNEILTSENGMYTARFTAEGNLVVIWNKCCSPDKTDRQVWQSNTYAKQDLVRLVMQSDGNLIIFNNSNSPIWQTRTLGDQGKQPFKLTMQNNGNLALLDNSGKALWYSNNNQAPK